MIFTIRTTKVTLGDQKDCSRGDDCCDKCDEGDRDCYCTGRGRNQECVEVPDAGRGGGRGRNSDIEGSFLFKVDYVYAVYVVNSEKLQILQKS